MVTVPYDTYNRERRRLPSREGNIVFLNDVDYDTSGKVSRTYHK
jgi:hypothetical protein